MRGRINKFAADGRVAAEHFAPPARFAKLAERARLDSKRNESPTLFTQRRKCSIGQPSQRLFRQIEAVAFSARIPGS
jgi:hypothetical protein